ncbi:hypothetical protein SPBR_06471 [Sporothrix brasiliensis 5110]|uniref:Uncharacterized protein n=1 Tax=Sporothrix brasiliensis 5110 TaxID=1398154 RepID=A0A0C2IGE5_9PEZI|nr:uncharacterized protein SPBR_06471 [Sporothrix brasiliensis 5110]KIH88261.1 hypothetical protein SPBR_06471 [Sporothrix brasiliensis 5110]
MTDSVQTGSGAGAATDSNLPGLWPPLTKTGVLKRLSVNISRRQRQLLDDDSSWIGSDGRPGPQHKIVPDKVLEYLQKQAAENKQLQAPSQPEEVDPREQQSDDTASEAVASKVAETAPVQSQTVNQGNDQEAVVPDQAVALPPGSPAPPATPQLRRSTAGNASGPRTDDAPERDFPASMAGGEEVLAPAPAAVALPVSASSVALAQVAAATLPREVPNGVVVVARNQEQNLTEQQPLSLAEPDSAVGPVPASEPEPEAEPDIKREPEAEEGPERFVAVENRSSPPISQREYSPDWGSKLASDDDDNDDGNDNREHDQPTQEEPAEQDEVKQQLLQQQQQPEEQQTPHLAPARLSETTAWAQGQAPYHSGSPDLGSSSPVPLDVELPDMLNGENAPMLRAPSRGTFSESVGDQPSSSPTPRLPRSSLRRPVPQELCEPHDPHVPHEHQSAGGMAMATSTLQEVCFNANNHERRTGVSETTSIGKAAAKPQPTSRLMKPPIFPRKAPQQTKPPAPAPGETISRNPNRQPSLRRPPLANIDRPRFSTSELSTSPTGTPNAVQRTETFSRTSTAHRAVDVVESPALAARVPTTVQDAVIASSPLPPVSARHSPASHTVSSKPASPTPSRTWMMPYESFTATYPDYKGDLEDFLRACYSLQHISPEALPGYVFDDVVHAFLDYIEYVQTMAAGAPQNLAQWYNLHSTALVHDKNVITRANVAAILKAYPDEVKAFQTNAQHSNVQAKASSARAETEVSVVGATAAPPPDTADKPEPSESILPGRPFPFEAAQQPSPLGSSWPSNSILDNLNGIDNSNSTDSHKLLRDHFGPNQSQSQSQSQSHSRSRSQSQQHDVDRPHRTVVLGATQSSWAGSFDDQLPFPGSLPQTADVPEGMDTREFLLRSPDPVQYTQLRSPTTQEFAGHGPETPILETPARPASSRKRGRQESRANTPREAATSGRQMPLTKTRGVSSAKKALRPADTPEQGITIENAAQGAIAGAMNSDDDEHDGDGDNDDDNDDYFETSLLSVKSAAEARRPPVQPVNAPSRANKEARRTTIAASDVGIVSRIAAAKEREAIAAKRVLPASMARAAADAQPPKKKKKTAEATKKRPSWLSFLKKERPRPA